MPRRREPARLPGPARGSYPYMPGLRRGSGGSGGALRAARAPRLHLPASSKPPSPHHPLTDHPEWPKRVLPGEQKRHLALAPSLPGFRPPASRPCGRLEPPNTGPTGAIRASRGPIRAGMRARESPRCSRGAQGAPPHHHPAYSSRSKRCSDFRGGRPRRPGDTETANPPPRPAPTAPPRSAAPDRPAGSPARRRRPLEPSPRGARARATASTTPLPLPSPLLEPSLHGAPRPTDRPVSTAALAARLSPRPVRHRARPGRPTAPLPTPSPPV